MGGSSPQATPIQLAPQIPPKPPPGYGAAQSFFEQIFPQLWSTPLPSYQGSIDPGLSPTMQNVIRGAQTYSDSPVPNSLEQASGTLGRFMSPTFQNPSQGLGAAPDYGFPSAEPGILPHLAGGGAAGYGASDAMKATPMQEGGGGGFGGGGELWDPSRNGGSIHPLNPIIPSGAPPMQGSEGYWWQGGDLAMNPNDPSGGLSNSQWGDFWNWVQGATGFQPGQQHGPGAQFWDAVPPAGFDYGRGGTTDPVSGQEHPYGWWDPSGPGGGPGIPDWLRGLNDEQMQYIFDLGGPDYFPGPGDNIGERIAGRGLNAPRQGRTPPQPGGGQGGGGGGMPKPDLNYQGIPSYTPVEQQSSFVSWDPGNPTPSMVAGNDLMPPPGPEFLSPPPAPSPAPSPGGGGGGNGGAGGGGGGGGAPAPRPQPGPPLPAQGASPQGGIPPWLLALMQGGSTAPRSPGMFSGGGAPPNLPFGETRPTRTGGAYSFPAYAEGTITDEPQLAMIGEAGPEVVLPLSRPAKDAPIRAMQERLGLPVKPMQTGGGAGMGGILGQKPPVSTKPAPMSGNTMTTLPAPLPGGGMTYSPGAGYGSGSFATKPAPMPLPGGGIDRSLLTKPASANPMGGSNIVSTKPAQRPDLGGWSLRGDTIDKGPGGLDLQSMLDQMNNYRSGNSLAPKPLPLPGETDPGPPASPGQGDPFGPTSAMDVYRAAVPVMNQEMRSAISNAMAAAGATGNRFGTSSERMAADIGGQYGLRQNQLMADLLYGQTQSDLDRALQAAGMAPQNALAMNQIAQDRIRLPFQIGAWEQGRQDQLARVPYEDFMSSRLGFMPDLFQLIASQGGTGGMSGQWGTQQTGGSPGAIDYASAFLPFLGLFMAEGGAAGYGTTKTLDATDYKVS